jgi:hypothetical protein
MGGAIIRVHIVMAHELLDLRLFRM